MAKRTFLAGATSQTVDVFIQDSSSTIGAGLSGLAFNTAGLKAYYRKGATGSATAITLATQTVGGAWSSGGLVEIDATNMKGVYRLDVPDTVFAASPYAIVYLYGATNMAPVVIEIEIVAYNPFDAAALGLSRIDAAVSSRMATYTQPTGFLTATFPSGTIANTTNITTAVGVTVSTYTGNTPQTGDAYARLGAPAGASVSADIAAIKSDTGTILTDVNSGAGAIFTRIGAPAGASIAADIAAVQAKTTNLPASPAATGDAMTLTTGERNSVADSLLDRASAVETGLTPRGLLRLLGAVLAGTLSGGGTTTNTFNNAVANSKPRVTATVDSNGNRTAITTDMT